MRTNIEVNERVYLPEQETGGKTLLPVTVHDREGFYVLLDNGQTTTVEAAGLRPEPGPHRQDWIDFLRYLADGMDGHHIADVVEKPHNYGEEYAEYLDAGGLER